MKAQCVMTQGFGSKKDKNIWDQGDSISYKKRTRKRNQKRMHFREMGFHKKYGSECKH